VSAISDAAPPTPGSGADTTARPLATAGGKRVLALLCAIAFLDFVDASITNIALPHIRRALQFSTQDLQWVPSAYLLTYGGFMLLGGRLADLLGRRDVLLAGSALLAAGSTAGGFAGSSGLFIAARLVQGIGAALMLPAALSTLTTTFSSDGERRSALGAWGATAGLSSAVGILAGGLLVQGPGWRWVMFINPIAIALLVPAILRILPRDRAAAATKRFDVPGAALITAAMLLLVFALVRAPIQGWGAPMTWVELAGAGALLVMFVLRERSAADPLLPLDVFRARGRAAANLTGLIGFAGMLAMFFFLTLYMQTVLGYSPFAAGAAYLPLTFAVGISAGVGAKLIERFGTRPAIFGGAVLAAGGMVLLARVPVHGSYARNILPATLLFAAGIGPVFVGVTSAATAGASSARAGLVAAILNSAQQVGGALGLAIFSAVATSRTAHLLATGTNGHAAAIAGYHRAFLLGGAFALAAAVISLRTVNSHHAEM